MKDNNYKYELKNIKVEGLEGGLFANFDIIQKDDKGDTLKTISTGEWIDLNNGFIEEDPASCNLSVNFKEIFTDFDSEEIEEINLEELLGEVDDWLRENSISEETLESYRAAKAEREEEQQAYYSI